MTTEKTKANTATATELVATFFNQQDANRVEQHLYNALSLALSSPDSDMLEPTDRANMLHSYRSVSILLTQLEKAITSPKTKV